LINALEKIVSHKRGEIEAAKRRVSPSILRARLRAAPPVRDFLQALRAKTAIALIAEVKKASPSAGLIREDFDPVQIAAAYEQNGAACISVLTDEHFFQGSLADLQSVRQSVAVPVLRKDFLLDPYQLLESRAAGADCVLLIAECLDDDALRELHTGAQELGMQTLTEVYEPQNLPRVLALKPALVGVNNRDLKTFTTDLNHSIRLAAEVPATTLLVSESGIQTRDDIERLERAGIGAILVGETLMRAPDIGAKVRELLGSG
jgi:indole-3-glycerol phosphate synthase